MLIDLKNMQENISCSELLNYEIFTIEDQMYY